MNPCPCGKHAPGAEESPCECDEATVRRYTGRVSGPLLDRIDMCLDVPPVRWRELRREPSGEPSAIVRERVMEARERATARWSGRANADMGVGETGRFCRTSGEAARLLRSAVRRFGLSARAYHRVLRVARTVADLGGAGDLTATHVAEAVQYRASSLAGR
jgi:magnesium chelatase family protein